MQRWISPVWKSLATLWLGAASLMALAASEKPATVPLRLEWEVQRNVFTPEQPDGRSLASFTLTNLGDKPLPAQGWALYFNCVAGVELKGLVGPFVMDRVSGTWYRLRPTAAAVALGQGQSTRLSFFHPEIMVKTAKGPTGPYVVFDDAPKVGYRVQDYVIAPFTRAEQWNHGPKDPMPLITPQEVFRRNANIQSLPDDALPPVFPTPVQFERRAGTLRWTSLPRVEGAPALRQEVAFLQAALKPYFAVATPNAKAPAIRLAVAPVAGQSSPEAYELTVDAAQGVTLTGNTAAGVARGLQSLRDLLPVAPQPQQGVSLAALRIVDAPRFAYRGFQMDVARNFQPKAAVLRLLDLMARYKLNKFHFHLTDDEGWRLEIPGLPELTQVGARRGHTLDSLEHLQPAYGSGPDVRDPYGSGFYTRADYIEILKYAAARHIEVIPEIEMPGHARAAVKAMESRFRRLEKTGDKEARRYLLSDLDDKSEYRSPQLYTDHVMNPGLPSTYAFVDHVLDEVAALHKQAGVALRTIHVGADELPRGAWEKSPATGALMQREKLASRAEVWNYFYDHVDRTLRRLGLVASGWEELGTRNTQLRGEGRTIPNPAFVQRGFRLYVWNNLDDSEDLAYRLANAGYDTILAPATNLYFDMAHNKNPDEPGVNWAAYTDLDAVFDFVPLDFVRKSPTDATPKPHREGLTDYGKTHVLGLEGTLFSETVRSAATLDYLLMPRLLGLAHRAWAADPAWARETDPTKAQRLHDADWSVFVHQLGRRVLPKLDVELPGVLYRIPPPGLSVVGGQVHANHQFPGFTLRYTVDGSEPTAASPVLTGPLAARGVIRAAAFTPNGRASQVARIANP